MTDLLERARKKGTDKQFRRWISFQPSCITHQFSEWVDGVRRCEAAHVRRAGQSGTGYKAEFSCVPLTRNEHHLQHQHGEASLLSRYLGAHVTAEEAKSWFNEQRIKYLELWIES